MEDDKPSRNGSLFMIAVFLCYILAYNLYALDRTVIYSWINLIHYVSQKGLLAILSLCLIVSWKLGGNKLGSRRHVPVLLAASILLIIPYIGSTQPETDFLYYYTAARHIQENGFFNGVKTLPKVPYRDIPLLPLAHAFVFKVVGESHVYSESIHRIAFILLGLSTYLLARKIIDPQAGFYAGMLVVTTPIILAQNHLIMQDIPLTLLIVSSTYFAYKSMENRIYSLPAFFCGVLAILMKISGVLYLASVGLPLTWMWINKGANRRKRFMAVLAAAAISSILLFSVIHQTPTLKNRLLERGRAISLTGNLQRFFKIGTHIPVSSIPFQIGFPQTLLFLAGSHALIKKRHPHLCLLAAWTVIPFLVLHDLRIRYQIPYFPAISIIAAYGLTQFNPRIRGRIFMFSVTCMALITVSTTPAAADSYTFRNLQEAVAFSDSLPGKTLGVYNEFYLPWMNELPLVSATDYYSDKEVYYLGDNGYKAKTGYQQRYRLLKAYANLSYYGQTDSIIKKSYVLLYNNSGGERHFHNPFETRVYARKEGEPGPTDIIVKYSNIIRPHDELVEYSFWGVLPGSKRRQTYSYGPIKYESFYGTWNEDWLGEKIMFMKPPDNGFMNVRHQVTLPEFSRLRFSVSLRPDTWHYLKGDGVGFNVFMECENANQQVYSKYIDPKNREDDRKLHPADISLERCWGKKAIITFQTVSGPNQNSIYDTAGFGSPRIVIDNPAVD